MSYSAKELLDYEKIANTDRTNRVEGHVIAQQSREKTMDVGCGIEQLTEIGGCLKAQIPRRTTCGTHTGQYALVWRLDSCGRRVRLIGELGRWQAKDKKADDVKRPEPIHDRLKAHGVSAFHHVEGVQPVEPGIVVLTEASTFPSGLLA